MGQSGAIDAKDDKSLVYTDLASSGCNECGSESFNVELSDKVSDENYSKGVIFTTFGDSVRLAYDGQLAKSGAAEVFAVVNTVDGNNAQNTSTYPMNSTNRQSYELSIPARIGSRISVAFKDSSNNWDNNSGKNYSYFIQ